MATNERSKVIQHLRRVALCKDGAGLTDAQLLQEYLIRREEAALAALVRRHGPMIWGVCRRILHNYHDAEDAFQATFLVFVRKAASIASPELLANWLYGVAHQTALKARATAAKRKTREMQVKDMPEPPAAIENDLWNELQPILDQELSRLSDKYRSAIVLCDLEGKTRREAARHLGVPEGTLAARLARGRKLLAMRLARHGLAVSCGSLATALESNTASASVPNLIVGSTIKAASLLATGQAAAAGGISIKAVALMEGVLKAMFLSKLKIATALVLGIGLLGTSWRLYPTRAAEPPEAKQEAAHQPSAELAVPSKEGGNPTKDKQSEKRVGLPKGPPPVQVLVSLTKDGKLRVKVEHMLAVKVRFPPLPTPPVTDRPHSRQRILIRDNDEGLGPREWPKGPIELTYELKEIQVLDTNGEQISKEELAKCLKEETVAVATFGDQTPDQLHLRILKEGTLVFILPLPPEDKMPFPETKEALYQRLGPAAFWVWFLRKQPPNPQTTEP